MDLLREKLRCTPMGARAFGGGSSSQAQTSTYTDNRRVLGQGAQEATSGGTITDLTSVTNYTLDGQVVKSALDTVDNTVGRSLNTVDHALNVASNAQSDALGTVGDALGKVASFSNQALDQVAGSETLLANAYSDAKGQGALTQKILIVAVVGALLIAFAAVQKKA